MKLLQRTTVALAAVAALAAVPVQEARADILPAVGTPTITPLGNGLFRWEYTKPYEQLIVADGSHVWVYDPDLQQVTRRAQGAEEQNSPLAALVDPAKLERDYVLHDAGNADGLDWLDIAPKKASDTGFRSARLGFGPEGLATMQVTDALGQKTRIEFSHWQRNPAFSAGTFRFVPAKGVDVVGEG